MVGYLLKLLVLIFVAFSVIVNYYGKDFSFHNESFTGYTMYVIFMFIAYGVYKFFQINLDEDKVRFSPFSLFLYFVGHLFLLTIVFFSISSQPLGYSMVLFFKIILYSIIPVSLVLLSYSTGKKIMSYIKDFGNETITFRFLSSLGLGFSVFLSLLTIFGSLGLYNIYSVLIIILGLGFFSFKEIKSTFFSIFDYKIELPKHDSDSDDFFSQVNLYLLSSEFLFIVLTFLLSVNLINIVRPMPIGWDDLGVYMNLPQIMALGGDIKGYSIVAWQTFTGIGFMIHSNVQAFFLNNVGGFLSAIVIALSIGDLLKSTKKTFINIPLLASTIILSMPMVVFQQAKDMKLDPGLLFVTVIAIYMIFYVFLKYIGYKEETEIKSNKGSIKDTLKVKGNSQELIHSEKTDNSFSFISYKFNSFGRGDLFENKTYLIYIFIIGIIAGLAFAIKFTTLMLVIAFIGIIFFAKLGFSGFLGYFALFLAIFTKAKLWDYMNVAYPKDNITLINNFSLFSAIIGIVLLAYAFYKYKLVAFKKAFVLLIIFISGFVISMLPWFAKNIYEASPNINISSLLNGKPYSFKTDYTKIYSKKEIDDIAKKYDYEGITSSGTSQNEDMGRYLGYDKGANNLLKMPYNLTMQVNQRGEFTDITFIFLALLPVVLLFLAFKFEFLSLGIIGFLATEIILFGNKFGLSAFIGNYDYPLAYIFVLIAFLLPTIYFIYGLKNDMKSQLFRLNMIFAFVYIFLWTIAAFGIVWYGIALYFSLIFMIAIGIDYMSSYNDKDLDKDKLIKFFGSILVLAVVSVYFFSSSFPHGFTNLQQASYISFKAGQVDQVIGIFESHPDYFKILFELNIKDDSKAKVISDIKAMAKDENLKKFLANINTAEDLDNLLKEIQTQEIKGADTITMQTLRQEASQMRETLYDTVLYPTKDMKNEEGIYRIGTFLTYFISENRKRFLDDSLVMEFHKYIYDTNPDIAIERIKKLGTSYFLTDLNAATIDRDPRHDLTKRFEELLFSYTSDKLELVSTDSMCLRVALDDYKKSDKSEIAKKEYIKIAGVNYESYETDASGNEKTIARGEKQLACYNHILTLLQTNKIDQANYSYLLPIKNYLERNKITDQNQLLQIFQQYITHGWLAVFKIK
ncbi:MAG: hypothetical protein PHG82_03990 [Candidatus Gracilibacteria bacterium]|nr:hypothetical protein [Candidatus Gracilibacteria bacterium]